MFSYKTFFNLTKEEKLPNDQLLLNLFLLTKYTKIKNVEYSLVHYFIFRVPDEDEAHFPGLSALQKKMCFMCFSRDRNNILVVMINHVFL